MSWGFWDAAKFLPGVVHVPTGQSLSQSVDDFNGSLPLTPVTKYLLR